MIEFCLGFPILVSIIAAIFLVGWLMVNQQHVKVSKRYVAWKKTTSSSPSTGEINSDFFSNNGRNVAISHSEGSTRNLLNFVDNVANESGPASGLADEMLMSHFPKGQSIRVSSEFPLDRMPDYLEEIFSGAIQSTYSRDGVTWQRGQSSPATTVTNQYINDLDQGLVEINSPGDNFARMIRRLYLNSSGGW